MGDKPSPESLKHHLEQKMDAANATPSLTPALSDSITKTKAKEITDELQRDRKKKETTEHVDRLDVVVDLDLSLRLSKLPTMRDFIRPDYKSLPLIFQFPIKSDETNYFFTPRVVSVGPYHHGKSWLAKMERHKSRFLEEFLSHSIRSLEHYRYEVNKTLELFGNDDYDMTQFDLTRDELVDIMMLDGCFILQFLIKIYNQTPDEIFQNETLLRYIRTDLLMFGNQVPFFVLRMLHRVRQNDKGPIPTIYELLGYYFWGTKDEMSVCRNCTDSVLLHSYSELYIFPLFDDGSVKFTYPEGSYGEIYIENSRPVYTRARAPSAQQLEKAGVVFKAKRSASFLDITFHEGVLEIPVLSMDEPFILLFVNLFMSDLHVNYHLILPSYCRFMACLLETSNDIAILRKHGIIESKFLIDRDLLYLFHHFGNLDYLFPDWHYFTNLFDDLWFFYIRLLGFK